MAVLWCLALGLRTSIAGWLLLFCHRSRRVVQRGLSRVGIIHFHGQCYSPNKQNGMRIPVCNAGRAMSPIAKQSQSEKRERASESRITTQPNKENSRERAHGGASLARVAAVSAFRPCYEEGTLALGGLGGDLTVAYNS